MTRNLFRCVLAVTFVFLLGCTSEKGNLKGYFGSDDGGSSNGGNTAPSNAVIMIPSSPVLSLIEGTKVKAIIQFNRPLPRPVTMSWEIENGDKDFEVTSGFLTASQDAETVELEIQAKADGLYEGDEKFFLKLTGDANVFLSPLSIPINIPETGAPLMLAISGPGTPGVTQQTLTEGPSVEAQFFIRLSAPADFPVQVKFDFTGSASLLSDFTTTESGSVTFAPGEINKTIKVSVVNDNLGEPAENIIITLSSVPVGNVTIDNDNKVHTINIIDDDLAGAFYIAGVTGGTDTKIDGYLVGGIVPTIHWTDVLDEVDYKILVKNNGGAIVCDEVTVPADTLSYTFDTTNCKSAGVPYTFVEGQKYKVEARVNVSGSYSNASNSGVFTFIVDSTPPAAFSILGALGGGDREPDNYLAGSLKPTIAWQNTTGEKGYKVGIYSQNGGAEVCAPVTVPANNVSYTFANCELSKGSFYKATVEAFDDAENKMAATNNDFEFFVTEVPSGYTITGVTGGTADITADQFLNDTGFINPMTTVYDPVAFKVQWQAASGIDHFEVVVLNLNGTVKCPKISTALNYAVFYGCRLDLNIQYKIQVSAFDINNIQYIAANSPYTFRFQRGLYLSGDPSFDSYYRGIPITSCGGTSQCNSAHPYEINTSIKEDQIVIDKGAVMSAPAWITGPLDVGNGRLDIEVDYLRIENGGSIIMNAKGSTATLGTGAGLSSPTSGTGGAYGGNGSLSAAGSQAKAYGSAKNPVEMGSGGGSAGAVSGGTGGGSLILKINEELYFNSGNIESNGSSGGLNAGGGSGGSIHLTAKKISGSGGRLKANGAAATGTGGPGSGGRIAMFYESITHSGGLLGLSIETLPGNKGGASGTLFYKNTKSVGGDTYGYLVADTGIYPQTVGVETPIPLEDVMEPSSHLFDKVLTKNQGTFIVEAGKVYTLQSPASPPSLDYRLVLAGDLLMPTGTDFQIGSSGYLEWRREAPNDVMNMYSNIIVQGGGVLTHSPNVGTDKYHLDIQVTGDFLLFGSINATGKGFGPTYGGAGAASGTEGAGYGGQGGFVSNMAARGSAHGKIIQPDVLGSGSALAAGGGLVKIKVDNDFKLSGSISVDGADGCGGGSGGSVWIRTKSLSGNGGVISSQGGGTITAGCGGGGGGRIAVLYESTTYPGGVRGLNFLASGGDATVDGAAGTIFHKKVGVETLGHLMVLNTIRDYNEKIVTPLDYLNNPNRYNSIVTDSRGTLLIDPTFDSSSPFSASYTLPSDEITYRVVAEGDFALPVGSDLKINDGGYLEIRRATPYTFNSLTVTSNGLLTHSSNKSTKAYLIHFILGTLNLDGVIDVSRRGYAGDFGSGVPINYENGAGHGGFGGNRGLYQTSTGGAPYNEAKIKEPDDFGSGSRGFTDGAYFDGVSGGGLVRFDVAGDFNFKGQILADGNQGICSTDTTPLCNGGGAGGSIYINANVIKGVNGTLSANGGNGAGSAGAGAGGRIAVVYGSDATYAEGTIRKLIDYEKIRAFGGTTYSMKAGAAGSIFLKSAAQTDGEFIFNNGGNPHPQGVESLVPSLSYNKLTTLNKATLLVKAGDIFTVPSDLDYRLVGEGTVSLPANLTIKSGGYLEWRKSTNINLGNLTIESGGVLTHSYNYGTDNYRVNLVITGDLELKGGGAIDVSNRGYQPGYKNTGSGVTGAGAYGGMSGSGNLPYGNFADPDNLGSGGAAASGGGAMRITVSGTTTLNGNLFANGQNAPTSSYGSGAGGSIYLDTNILQGVTGAIRANGGSDSSYGASGGRIAILYNTDNYPISYLTKSAFGGDSSNIDGAAGTIFYREKDNVADLGYLIINNTGRSLNSGVTTVLPQQELSTVSVDAASAVEIKAGETVRLPTDTVGYRLIVAGNLKIPTNKNTLIIDNNGVLELKTLNEFGNKAAANGDVKNIKVKPLGKIIHTANPAGVAPWNASYKVNLNLDVLELQGNIDVTGRGWPGGNGPCASAIGACHAGIGGNGIALDSSIYGSITNPQSFGSGAGSGVTYGGAGGGLVQMDVNTLNLSGQIISDGGRNVLIFGSDGGASGGSINLKIGTLIGGGGRIYARGYSSSYCGGGGGRIALDVTTDSYTGGIGALLIYAGGGSSGSCYLGGNAGAGTIHLHGPFGPGSSVINRLVLNNGPLSYTEGREVVINSALNVDEVVVVTPTTGIYVPAGIVFEPKSSNVFYPLRIKGDVKFPNASVGGSFNPATDHWGDVTVQAGGFILFDRPQDFSVETTRFIYNNFVMEPGGTVTHPYNADKYPVVQAVNIQAKNLFHMKPDSVIDVSGRGYSKATGPGAGLLYLSPQGGINYPTCNAGGSGGSYGGLGGGSVLYLDNTVSPSPTYGFVPPARPVYETAADPLKPGSSGGSANYGGAGGGLVVIRGDNQVILEGQILANGLSAGVFDGPSCSSYNPPRQGAGGGSGGAINITAKFLSGAFGSLQARGGNAPYLATREGGAGGGGGRIAVKFPKPYDPVNGGSTYTGTLSYDVSGGAAFIDAGTSWDNSTPTNQARSAFYDNGFTRQGSPGTYYENP